MWCVTVKNCRTNFSRTETEINQSVFRKKNTTFSRLALGPVDVATQRDSMAGRPWPQVLLDFASHEPRPGWMVKFHAVKGIASQ